MEPVNVICTYRVALGHEEAFKELLSRHWPTLSRLGLTSGGLQQFRGSEGSLSPRPVYYEIFAWRDSEAMDIAHQSQEVRAIWEQMSPLCEERGELRPMQFSHVEELSLARPLAQVNI